MEIKSRRISVVRKATTGRLAKKALPRLFEPSARRRPAERTLAGRTLRAKADKISIHEPVRIGTQPLPRPTFDPRAPFDAAREFPNFLVPAHIAKMHPDAELSPRDEHRVQHAAERLQAAATSVMRRIELPITIDGATRSTAIFPYLQAAAGERARVQAGGGVVRAILATLMRQATAAGSHEEAMKRLTAIAASRSPVKAYEVLGPGSDVDIYVEGKADMRAHLTGIVNSMEAAFGARHSDSPFKRAIFSIGDVKDREAQTAEVTRQGGSQLDWLALDAERGFITPTSAKTIVTDFVRGYYRYVAPSSPVEDLPKQTIRGMRPLIEIPNLVLADDAQLRKELFELEARQDDISADAKKQFVKMTRNQWWEGANNRFRRAAPATIEAIGMRVSQKWGAPMPEFVGYRALETRALKAQTLNGTPLMPIDDFLREHTNQGWVYHGTSQPDHALAIMRGGLFVSGDGQGDADFGRGVYTSRLWAAARDYAKAEGAIFALEVKRDPRLRILDWEKFSADAHNGAFIAELDARAEALGKHRFEVLAHEHDIDLVIHRHVLLQNSAAVRFHDSFSPIVQAYGFRLLEDAPAAEEEIRDLTTYAHLHAYASALDGAALRSPHDYAETVLHRLATYAPALPYESSRWHVTSESIAALLPLLPKPAAAYREELRRVARFRAEQIFRNSRSVFEELDAYAKLYALLHERGVTGLVAPATYRKEFAARVQDGRWKTDIFTTETLQKLIPHLQPLKAFEKTLVALVDGHLHDSRLMVRVRLARYREALEVFAEHGLTGLHTLPEAACLLSNFSDQS